MQKESNRLKILFFTPIVMAVLFAAGSEFGIIESGYGVTEDNEMGCIMALTVMEVATLCAIPLALRLFKFGVVAKRVKASRSGFMRFATVRILLLALPLLANTLLYYYYVKPTFLYLAIMLLLSMAFVYPSKSRCENETE
jgi:hypothetical protein